MVSPTPQLWIVRMLVQWCSGVGVVVAAAASQDMDFSIFPLVCTPQSNYQLTHCNLRVSDFQLHNYNIT